MVSVDDEDGDDTAALALASLRKATKELNELADFCEQNYCDEPATGNARSQQESKPLNPSEPFPGRNESLSQTADFAVRALQAVAANVAILAEDAELRVARLADDVGALGQDIQWAGLQIDMAEERVARRVIRKLAQKKEPPVRRPALSYNPGKESKPIPYVRRPIDYAALDHVGHGGARVAQKNSGGDGDSADSVSTTNSASSRSPKSAKQPQAGGGTIRRGTFRRNASCQSNRSSLTSLAVSGRKVMEMPKAPPLRPKAKDETPREKQSEETHEATLRPPRPPTQQPAAGAHRLTLLPEMPGLDDFGLEMEPIYDEEFEEDDDFLPPPPPPPGEEDDELEDIIGQMNKLQAELGLVNINK